MSDINELISYLKEKLQLQTGSAQNLFVKLDERLTALNFQYDDVRDSGLYLRVDIPSPDLFYPRIVGGDQMWYRRENNGDYSTFLSRMINGSRVWHQFNASSAGGMDFSPVAPSGLQPVPDEMMDQAVFYLPYEELYFFEIGLPVIDLSPQFYYDHQHVANINVGWSDLQYVDYMGSTDNLVEDFYKSLKNNYRARYDDRDRHVHVNLSRDAGTVRLYPIVKNDGRCHNILFNYTAFPRMAYPSIMGKLPEETAIMIRCKTVIGMIEVLNQTVFTLEDYERGLSSNKKFMLEYHHCVSSQLKYAMDNKLDDLLFKLLWHLPGSYLNAELNDIVLWNFIDARLQNGLIDYLGENEEEITIKLIDVLIAGQGFKAMMDFLMESRKGKLPTRLQEMIATFDGDNFDRFIKVIWDGWSSYLESEAGKSLLLYSETGISLLPYEQDNVIGFTTINADIEFPNGEDLIKIIFEPEALGYDVSTTDDDLVPTDIVSEEDLTSCYHPFEPVAFLNSNNPEFTFGKKNGVATILPAFILYGADERADVDDWKTAGEYALDIATLATGVGNVYRFRHLLKLSKLQQVVRIGKAARVARAAFVNLIEISSGSLSLMIKLAELENEPWARDLQEVLFWLEVASLGVEISDAVAKKLRASGKRVIQKQDVILDQANDYDELLRRENALDEIADIADAERRRLSNWDGGKLLSERTLRKRIRTLTQKYSNFDLKVEFVDESNNVRKLSDWNKRNVLGSFNQGPPPVLYFRHEVTELTWQHEVWHLEDLQRLGSKNFTKPLIGNWRKWYGIGSGHLKKDGVIWS